MNQTDQPQRVSRRGFLAGGAAAIVTVAVTGTTVLMDPAGAWAVDLPGFTPDEARALLKVVRDLFPHERLADVYYANAIAPLGEEASKDASAKKLLADGIAQLNRLAQAAEGAAYADVADEKARVGALKKMEGSPFFSKVYSTTIVTLYNQPDVWPKFGYEGPSSDKGGYLHRGFDDINWL
jgi:hypothetical protein